MLLLATLFKSCQWIVIGFGGLDHTIEVQGGLAHEARCFDFAGILVHLDEDGVEHARFLQQVFLFDDYLFNVTTEDAIEFIYDT